MTAGRKSSQNKQGWNTPQKYSDSIFSLFGVVELDPCSNQNSIVRCKTKIILPIDGLKEVDWSNYKTIYINPPFGRDYERKSKIKDWIQKAYFTSMNHTEVEITMLIPVATNTSHWKEYILGKASICFLEDTRVVFRINGKEDNKGSPMACAMIYYGKNKKKFKEVFSKYGFVYE